MWYLYLDESGDLGFDFVNKKPSNFFTVTILAVSESLVNKRLSKAVRKTLDRKLNKKRNKRRIVHELKATGTTLEIKKYIYNLIAGERFGLYSVTLNKRRVFEQLTKNKERTYNWVARQVLDQIPFEKANDRVQLIMDKCKAKPEVKDFNQYIQTQLLSRIAPTVPLDIDHLKSHDSPGLQLVDLFCWGFFQKYERKNTEWFDEFKDKVRYDTLYLPETKTPIRGSVPL
jgi:hypothetical protein